MSLPPLLRAHSESVRRRLPHGWHGKLYGPGYAGRFRGVPVYVDPYTPWPGQLVGIDLSQVPASDHPGHPGGFRPLSTLALHTARPLLDAMQEAVHRSSPR